MAMNYTHKMTFETTIVDAIDDLTDMINQMEPGSTVREKLVLGRLALEEARKLGPHPSQDS